MSESTAAATSRSTGAMPGLTTFSKVDVSKMDMSEYEEDDKDDDEDGEDDGGAARGVQRAGEPPHPLAPAAAARLLAALALLRLEHLLVLEPLTLAQAACAQLVRLREPVPILGKC